MLNVSAAYLRPGFAFGGSCLPKDVRSFLALAGRQGVPTPFLSQLLPGNAAVIERAYAAIARQGRQRVACSAWPSSRAPTICANRPSCSWPNG